MADPPAIGLVTPCESGSTPQVSSQVLSGGVQREVSLIENEDMARSEANLTYGHAPIRGSAVDNRIAAVVHVALLESAFC